MSLNPRTVLADLTRQCRSLGTTERAEFEQGYMKTDMAFFGATVPQLRKLTRGFLREHKDLTREDLAELVEALYEPRNHNLCHIACILLAERSSLLKAADARWVVDLVRRSHTWALVDMLAVEVLGDLTERFPGVANKRGTWVQDDDLWVRRSALLTYLKPLRSGEGDLPAFVELALPLAHEKEFFIRKAIGWVLREASKKRPDEVFEVLLEHRDELSGLTLREGAKRLSEEQRDRLR